MKIPDNIEGRPRPPDPPGKSRMWIVWTVVLMIAVFWMYATSPDSSRSPAASPALRWNQGDDPRIGISTIDARQSSWGSPSNTSRTTSVGGETEFWHYDRGVLMFRDGVLVSITDRR